MLGKPWAAESAPTDNNLHYIHPVVSLQVMTHAEVVTFINNSRTAWGEYLQIVAAASNRCQTSACDGRVGRGLSSTLPTAGQRCRDEPHQSNGMARSIASTRFHI